MLLTKTVKMRWNSRNKKYYESKGYIYTKMDDEFEVSVDDLSRGSQFFVQVRCDNLDCKNPYKIMMWGTYLKCLHEDNKYYCNSCCKKVYNSKSLRKTLLQKHGKSFAQWCIENDHRDILDNWDYELNDDNPNEICYSTKKKYYFKCPRKQHTSELKNILVILKRGSLQCNKCNSFAQWCIDNDKKYILELWDYELNKKNPYDINKAVNDKYYFKCPRGIHKSELRCLSYFTCENGKLNCIGCNSFEQWCKDHNRQDMLDRWDYDLNKCKPSEISHSSGDKYWFKCQRWLHKSELKDIHTFTKRLDSDMSCKVCNSFAQWGIDNLGEDFLDKYWNKENKINPWEIDRCSRNKVKIICQNNKDHGSYLMECYNFYYNHRCPICNESKGEKRITEYLIKNNFIKDKDYIPQKEFNGLVGIHNGNLSYDFYLLNYNLLIEYQGEFHYKNIVSNQSVKDFKKQQEHDKRKYNYAEKHDIKLLCISYWNFDNIEEILDKELKINNSEQCSNY